MSVHSASVCAWCVWGDAVVLFVAWFSGVEPELSRRTKVVLCTRIVAAVAVASFAVATL